LKTILLSLCLAATLTAAQAQDGSRYDPFYGVNGGWRFDHGGGARYDPFAGVNGGYRIDRSDGSSGGTYQWDPFKGVNGGWRYNPY
jgi:hypothetical protein